MALNHFLPVPKLSGFSLSPSSQSTPKESESNLSRRSESFHPLELLDCHDGLRSTANSPGHTCVGTATCVTDASHVCLCAWFAPCHIECLFRTCIGGGNNEESAKTLMRAARPSVSKTLIVFWFLSFETLYGRGHAALVDKSVSSKGRPGKRV